MLIELLSTSNYVSFNIKLAELLGLHSAIYVAELMNINEKAIRKEKLNESSFLLDRDYVCKRTTLPPKEQLSIEKNLIKLGIIEKPSEDENCIVLNITTLTTLLMSTDEDLISNVKKLSSTKSKRETKADAIRNNLKTNIVTTNVELLKAYSDWIDAVYANKGWMSKQAVIEGQRVVDEFSKRDLDVALRLINIATIHGYVDMTWAINRYDEQYKVRRVVSAPLVRTPNISTKPVGVSSEVF